jgi:peptide/nickel transport system substrate-binding protein
MRKVLVAALAASAVALVGTGAVGAASHAASSTVTMALPADPGTLDPQLTVLNVARQLDDFTYDTLIHQFAGGKIVSGLASSWRIVSPTEVRFVLRAGITCADGTKLTASTVKANLDFVGNPANKSPLLGVYVPPNPTVVANDKTRTVTVTMQAPNPFPLQSLGSVHMVCPRGLANRSALVHGAVGSGPYKLTKVAQGSQYTLSLRKGYTWGPGGATSSGMPATVVLKVVSNETTAANLLLTGGLNIAVVSGPDRSRLDKAKLPKQLLAAQPGEIWFNENKGHPGAEASVRRGLVQALNLSQLGAVYTSGRGVPMRQLTLQTFAPCAGNSVKGNAPAYNPGAARGALGSHPALKLLYPTDGGSGFSSMMELAQQQLNAVGASATLAGTTTANLQAVLFGTGDWDVALVPIGVSSPAQLVSFLSGPTPPNGANFAGIDNAQYSSHVAAAMKQAGAAGCKDWLAAEAALIRGADLAPTSFTTSATYGNGVKFALGDNGVVPATLRVTKKK